MDSIEGVIAEVGRRLREARAVAAITGAGVSAESGLRTFRGATAADLPADMRALWKEFDPQTLATPEAFEADPAMVTRWYDWRRLGCLAAEPNPGHLALAEIERRVVGSKEHAGGMEEVQTHGSGSRGTQGTFTLLTQNVDRLHQKAGSVNVVELHGTIITWRCMATGREVMPGAEAMAEYPPKSPFAAGAMLRPNVVWFGEALPEEALRAAHAAATSCDVFLSVGTSSVVWPAAGFVEIASANGAYCVEVNAEATPASRVVDAVLRGKSGEVLPRVVKAAWGG